jgi:hypothetical protein
VGRAREEEGDAHRIVRVRVAPVRVLLEDGKPIAPARGAGRSPARVVGIQIAVRRSPDSRPMMITVCHGSSLTTPSVEIRLAAADQFVQLQAEHVRSLKVDGRTVTLNGN